MINVLLFFVFFIIFGQCNTCQICIIDSTCGDDFIHFNVSISNECRHPTETYFSYTTDVESEKHYLNITLPCENCQFDLTIETIHDAWDYTLTLESPGTNKTCSIRKARCGGYTSRYVWIGTASISGLFAILGGVLCTIRLCRARKQMKASEKKTQESVVNA
jgi:hypothetical protein